MSNEKPAMFCSFCGSHQDTREMLISGGPATFICEKCVDECAEIVAETLALNEIRRLGT